MGKYIGIPRVDGSVIVWDPGLTSGDPDAAGNHISVNKIAEDGFATEAEAAVRAEELYPQQVSNPPEPARKR